MKKATRRVGQVGRRAASNKSRISSNSRLSPSRGPRMATPRSAQAARPKASPRRAARIISEDVVEPVFAPSELVTLEEYAMLKDATSKTASKTTRKAVPPVKKSAEKIAGKIAAKSVEKSVVPAKRRRHIDPTTCERDYSAAEVEFMNALDAYKRNSGRMFPTCSEILEVIRQLGYEKPGTKSSETPEVEVVA